MKNLLSNFFKPRGTGYYSIPNPLKRKNVDFNKVPLGIKNNINIFKNSNIDPPLILFHKLHKKFDKAASFYVNDCFFVVIFDPEMIEEIFLSKKDNFINGLTQLELRKIGLGDSLLTSESTHYLSQRRYFNIFFTEEKLKNYQKLVKEDIAEQSKHWNNKEIKIYNEMSLLSIRLIFKFFLNYDIKKHEKFLCKSMIEMERQISLNSLFPSSFFLKKILYIKNFKFNMQSKKIKKLVKKIIKHQIKNNIVSDSLIYNLIQEEKNKKITKKEILNHLLTIIITGFKTNASLSSWSIIRMSEQNEIIEKVKIDLEKNLVKNIIKETLRLHPSVWSMQRQVIKDVQLKYCFLPKGTYVLLCPYITHRDSKYYTDPYKWNPERWTDEMEKNLFKGSYFPFAMGIRQCIGKDLGILTSNEIIKHLSKNFYWKNLNNKLPTQIPLVTLLPDPNTTIEFFNNNV